MNKADFDCEYAACRALVERKLETYFKAEPMNVLAEAMRYSLLAGGKRIRPVMVLKFAEALGGNMNAVLPAACGVEMLHTYSLIHDDLPCMDNDELRRGKPTNHVVYGEMVATLAGDALQAASFEAVLSCELMPERTARMALFLARAAGADGMCLGQTLDMLGEGKTLSLEDITVIHDRKTAAMLVASAQIGVVSAGGSDAQRIAAEAYAKALGLAFQIRDDILDVTATTEALGKPQGSDAANNKTTFVTLYGIDTCESLIRQKTEEAISALSGAFENTSFLEALARSLEERKC